MDTVPERDRFEIALARGAIERDLPLLGICRGMQLINVACGGTLIQHLPDRFGHGEHRRVIGSFEGADHEVHLAEGSLAQARAPASPPTRPSPTTTRASTASARGSSSAASPRSTTASPRRSSCPARRFALGVQWHPEADEDSSVIEALVAAAARTRSPRPAASSARGPEPARAAPILPARAAVEGDPSDRVGMVAAGVAAPLLRRRLPAPPAVMQTVAFAAPLGLAVAVRRSPQARRRRLRAADVGLPGRLQDAARRRRHAGRRVHVDYPIVADRILGLGELPAARLQRVLARNGPDGPELADARPGARVGPLELVRRPPRLAPLHPAPPPRRFPRAAVMTYAVFDIGASFYWLAADRPALVRGRSRARTARRASSSRCGA